MVSAFWPKLSIIASISKRGFVTSSWIKYGFVRNHYRNIYANIFLWKLYLFLHPSDIISLSSVSVHLFSFSTHPTDVKLYKPFVIDVQCGFCTHHFELLFVIVVSIKGYGKSLIVLMDAKMLLIHRWKELSTFPSCANWRSTIQSHKCTPVRLTGVSLILFSILMLSMCFNHILSI